MNSVPEPRPYILVVEDDEATREALLILLAQEGYRAQGAGNGLQALELLRAGPRPALILLDLMMPVLDGWGFRAEQLRDPDLADIPIIVCSAAGNLPQQAADLHAAALLAKPVEFTQLLEAVRSLATAQRPGVLVVDDDPQVRRLLELALSRCGLTVWSAGNGWEAAELYRQHRDAIAVALLDVQMPGLDGPWTLAALQQVNPHVRAVFITGNSGDYDAELLLAMGAAGVLQKPFSLAEVAQAVRRLLPPGNAGRL
jgi:CheY-like chemotaxis protein